MFFKSNIIRVSNSYYFSIPIQYVKDGSINPSLSYGISIEPRGADPKAQPVSALQEVGL